MQFVDDSDFLDDKKGRRWILYAELIRNVCMSGEFLGEEGNQWEVLIAKQIDPADRQGWYYNGFAGYYCGSRIRTKCQVLIRDRGISLIHNRGNIGYRR